MTTKRKKRQRPVSKPKPKRRKDKRMPWPDWYFHPELRRPSCLSGVVRVL